MTNLLAETEHALGCIPKTVADIAWIGSRDGTVVDSWPAFAALADREYHQGYEFQNVAVDLVIVFTDHSWLERFEYDGYECWVYKACPGLALQTSAPLTRLFRVDDDDTPLGIGLHEWADEEDADD